MFRFLPEQASDFAHKVDWINNLITDLSVFFTVAIVGAMLYFAVRYRRRDGKDHETPQIRGSHFLEVVWTVVPTIISIVVAAYGVIIFREMRTPPKDAMLINVYGQKWKWDFEYENGKKMTKEIVVPVNKAVKLVMTSSDVLHSFFIPSMRVKMDAVPGQFTQLWFRPIKTGDYHVFCTEYCGDNHSQMLANLKVVSEAEYERWVNDRSEELALSRMPPSERGQNLFTQKGCNACHSLDGSRLVGPSFLKLFGKTETFTDGTSVTVDENYLKESILNPNTKIVESFAPIMPPFAGQLKDDEVGALIAFIRSVDGTKAIAAAPEAKKVDASALAAMTPLERGKKYYQEKLCNTCHSLDGSKIVGPSFKGIYGRKGKLVDGASYEASDDYIKNSIKNPGSQVVEGFTPLMPPIQLTDPEINDLIEFLKSVK